MSKVIAFLPARNEAENLPGTLESMVKQSKPFIEIILINDASTDETKAVAESFGLTVINLSKQHTSYVGRPEIAGIYNNVFDYLQDKGVAYDYLMQNGADTILPLNYVEVMTERMNADPLLVISGGTILGEKQVENHVRGSGRFYKAWFWDTTIKRFPVSYIWESYPLYKAMSMGLKVKHFLDLVMRTQRSTKEYKSSYGFAMRELGYIPPYALARSIRALMIDSKTGVNMMRSYLSGREGALDPGVKAFIQDYQKHHLLSLLFHPRTLLKRFLR